MKICRKCKQEKPLEAFGKNKTKKDGHQGECLACAAEYRALTKDSRNKNSREYYHKNKEKVRAVNDVWRKTPEGRAVKNAITAKRRASLLQRTPPWADQEAIKNCYKLSSFLTEIMGFPYHVDHELPLQGELVSGLHTHQNLRVVPAEDNLRKGNSFCPNSK